MIRTLGMGFCLLLVGCSTSGVKSPDSGDFKSTDFKSKEYESLKKDISSIHSSYYFGDDKPWLFTSKNIETYSQQFMSSHCPTSSKVRSSAEADACGKLFDRYVFSALSQTYFAADISSVEKKCATDPLICGDVMTFEVLLRNLHNQSIEQSKQEKLNSLEDWRAGKLTDEQLKEKLHIDSNHG